MKKKLTYNELEKVVKKFQKELKEKNQEVKKLKHSFLSVISHELRTPMNAILGFSSLLAMDGISKGEREEYLQYVQHCSNNLLSLFDNMIDAALLENNQLTLNVKECHLNELLDDLFEKFDIEKHRLEKTNIVLLKSAEIKNEDFTILVDEKRLTQVLTNLLNNALKFTDKGIVEFGYCLDEKKNLQFFVADTGNAGQRITDKSIFDSFIKLDDSASEKRFNGAGLGLSISKGLIELFGGKIWVEKNRFNGATFSFTVPMKLPQNKQQNFIKDNINISRLGAAAL